MSIAWIWFGVHQFEFYSPSLKNACVTMFKNTNYWNISQIIQTRCTFPTNRDISKLYTCHMQYKPVIKCVTNISFYLHKNSSHLHY